MGVIDACRTSRGLATRVQRVYESPTARWAMLIVGGLMLGLTVIFPQIGLLEWIALIPALPVIFDAVRDPAVRLRRLFGMGFVFFFSFLLPTFHWFLYMYPLDFAGMSGPASAVVVGVAWVGLSAFQAVGAALLLPIMALILRCGWIARRRLLHPLLLACLWVILEWWWAHSGWSGVPWSRLALGQAHLLPMLQSAVLFGSYALPFLIIATNGYLTCLLQAWMAEPRIDAAICSRRVRLAPLLLAVCLFGGNMAFGLVRLSLYREPTDAKTLRVAAIQGNHSSLDYWGIGKTAEVMGTYETLTRRAVADGAELVVWPETSIPVNIDTNQSVRVFLLELAESCGVPILVGVLTDVSPESIEEYNSIVVALPSGTFHQVIYHKRNPVPFGEFVPYRTLVTSLIPPLAEINTLAADIPAGTESVVFDLSCGRVGSLICFDSIYERNALESVANGAELLCVSTNDSWFKDSRGVWMHHAQSQLRAIENGRYVARSAVTGVSSVISPTGEVLSFLPPLEEGYALSDVTLLNGTTPYSVMGDVLPCLCFAATGFCLAYTLVWMPLPARCRKGKDDSALDAAEDE